MWKDVQVRDSRLTILEQSWIMEQYTDDQVHTLQREQNERIPNWLITSIKLS